MKIAFFGTPEFAGNILSGVLEYSEIDIKLIVSQPDRAAGRKKELFSTPVKQTALDNKIVFMQPEKILKNLEFHEALKNLDLDFIVVVAYGKIIPQAILDTPKYGCVNIHGSILPKYRGASPVQAAVKDGLKQTGLTTMYMSKGMDEGDILKVGKVDIDNVDTSEDIFKKFVGIGPELLVQTLREIISGGLKAIPQDPKKASHCGKISREDGEVFFEKQSAQEIYNTFRAYASWPGIYTWYEGKRLVLEEVILHIKPHLGTSSPQGERIQEGGFEGKPGEFIKLSKNIYGIICSGNKILEVTRVKLEGKKSMDTMSFVNGNREILNYTFM